MHRQTPVEGPLSGIRVLDMTSLGMGPLAGQILGDHGADVIKVEPLTGDSFRHMSPQSSPGMSHVFLQFNRNKRSIALDLKSDDGKRALLSLLKSCDIFLSNTRPSAMKSLGLDYEAIRLVNPKVIFCGAYGYSERGPYAGRPAADDTIQAMSGLTDLQQRVTGNAQFVATIVADKAVGLALVNSVLAALIYRMKTGKGQAIEVPMFETMVAFVLPEHMGGKAFEPSRGDTGYSRILNPQRRPYATQDGALCVLPYTTAQWLRFFKLIGRDDLAQDPLLQDPLARTARIPELYEIIAKVMPSRTTQVWVDALIENDIMFGSVNSIDDLIADQHLRALNMFPVVEHPTEGAIRLIGFPISFSESPCGLYRLPPKLGEHSRQVLAEIGYSEAELDRLESEKTIGCAA